MPIAGKRPQIVNVDLHQPGFARPANNSEVQRPAKKIREDGDDVNLHKIFNHRGHRVSQRTTTEELHQLHFSVFALCTSVVSAFAVLASLRPSAERLLRVSLRANSFRCACARDQSSLEIPARKEFLIRSFLMQS